MRRFIVNRLWACILACAFACCVIASAPHPSTASGVLAFTEGGDSSGGGGGTGTGGVTVGDPDVPTGSGKGPVLHGSPQHPSQYAAISGGGRSASTGAWMIRLRVVMQALRMRWLGI